MSASGETPFTVRPPPDQSSNLQGRVAKRLFGEDIAGEGLDRVAHFEILRRVGAGGMGIVYAARDTHLERQVAIKLVRRGALEADVRARLLQEARALAKLSHPNVVPVYEVDEHDGRLYISMELVEGETLQRWQSVSHNLRELLPVYLQAGAGLCAAHAAGIVHRDFKPNNVLVGVDGRVRVVDFGLALAGTEIDTPEEGAREGEETSVRIAGTPGYVAPELFAGRPPSPASDQFSFCVCLWEAVAGSRPFGEPTLALAHERGRLSAGALRPRWLRRLLLRGLAVEPEQRWPGLGELLARIEAQLRWRRLAPWAALPLLVGAGLSLALSESPEARACEVNAFTSAWTEERAFELLRTSTSVPLGARPEAVVDELDRYARLWTQAHDSLCNKYGAGSLSAEGLDLGQACLDEARRHTRGVVDRLLADPAHGLARADALLASLPDPEACIDLRRLRARPIEGALAAVRGAPLREQLRRGELALAAGEFESALATAEALVSAAETEALPALEAHGHALAAAAHREQGQLDRVRVELLETEQVAEAIGYWELVFHARVALTELAAHDLENLELADSMFVLARLPFEKLGESEALHGELLAAEARIAELGGRHGDVEELLRAAIAARRQTGAPPRALTQLRVRLANVLAEQGKDEALTLYVEILDEQLSRYGPDHPDVAMTAFDIGVSLYEAGRWSEAQPYLERAWLGQEWSRGAGSQRLASPLLLLADVEAELGRPARALGLAEHAGALHAELSTEHSEWGMAIATLAWIRLVITDYAGALALYEELLRASEDPWLEQRPATHGTIAWLLCRIGRFAEAEVHVDAALGSSEASVRDNAIVVAGELALARGEPRRALELVDDLLPRIEGEDEVDPQLLAEARLLRARARYAEGEPLGERARAQLADARLLLTADQRAWLDEFDAARRAASSMTNPPKG